MKFLRSFLRCHLAGKLVVAWPNVGCVLRLCVFISHTRPPPESDHLSQIPETNNQTNKFIHTYFIDLPHRSFLNWHDKILKTLIKSLTSLRFRLNLKANTDSIFKIAMHGVPDTDYSIIKRSLTRMFSIPKLLVARPLMMNWEVRYSGTRDVRHLKAMITSGAWYSPIKATGCSSYPFRGLNLWTGTA